MASHGPVSAAVVLCVAYAGLAVLNNISLKRRPSWDYTELTVFCWGKKLLTMQTGQLFWGTEQANKYKSWMLSSCLHELVRAVRVVAFACEAAASHHPDRLRNALFEGFYDGGFFLLLVVLYGVFRKW